MAQVEYHKNLSERNSAIFGLQISSEHLDKYLSLPYTQQRRDEDANGSKSEG
jgi:hypothetical protein